MSKLGATGDQTHQPVPYAPTPAVLTTLVHDVQSTATIERGKGGSVQVFFQSEAASPGAVFSYK